MNRRAYLSVVVTCAWALAPASAFAQPSPPRPVPKAKPAPDDPAQVHITQGAALYNDGNFSAALAEFEEAYRLKPAAYILNNIGLAQKALFHYPDAIATLQKFLDDSPTLSAEVRKQTAQIIAEMRALLAPVTLHVQPAGAAITVDGRAIGGAAISEPVAIAAGAHTIEVTADGYTSQKRDIMVSAGVAMTLDLALAAIPTTGKVHIVSSVQQATIVVDGRPLGSWTVRAELVAGGHTLDVSAPGYVHHHEELLLAAGQDREINVQLDAAIPERPWFKQWYVWTPVSIVVLGTIAGLTIDLTTHQAPLPGTLGLGKVE